ncbi:AAA family ATPase [Streptomyces hyaluromycini]|uniref:AAA family ATPase n=1 Tax=Streptomyces hyaluromycini TaxID=1377993 RepID=UPI000B5CDCE3|nr:AAA family ATPase [Streptomyces hyaluromycini]
MTALEELTREFGSAAVASAIVESLFDSGLEIQSRSVRTLRRGHTGARLAKAVLANVEQPRRPRWCVIKYCPPVQVSRRRESRLHSAALRAEPREFGEGHLTGIAFPPVTCPQGVLVIGQSKADGIPLGTVELDQLADACETIWREMLFTWTGDRYDYRQSTVAELLKCELGDSFGTDGWLRRWAQQRGLLAPAFLKLPDEQTPLPNPWRLFTEDTPEAQREIDYLVGRTHGDLHGDNILVPERNKIVDPARFRLIDLATYDPQAPLSRDLATLLISLCWHQIGASSPDSRSTFLAYLEGDQRDKRLNDGMPGKVRKIIDALREPALQFVEDMSWDSEQWFGQVKVSLLAQAMLHSAYETGPPDARRWCARLAGRLTRALLGPMDPQAALSKHFDAGEDLKATGMVAPPTTGRPTPGRSLFVDRTDQRSRLRAALDDQVTSVIVVSGPPGIGKTALVREVLTELRWADPDEESSAVRWHDATPYGEIGVPTLVKDIEPPGSGQIAGRYARARLEIALDVLEETGGIRPVIVLDSAENLLKDRHVLRDSELDLALEAVQRRPHPLVKVVFVTQHVPEATSGVAWTEEACRISLGGLEAPSLREYFAVLDPSNKYGLAALPEDDLRRVHGRLAGNPRLAELLHAALSSNPTWLPVREIGAWLSSMSASEVHQRLVHKLVDHLPAEQQRAAEGLAALGVPADTEAVIGVLETYLPGPRIEPALRALVAAGLVLERRDGRRYLRKSEIGAILGRLAGDDRWADEGEPPTRRELLARAAAVLRNMQKDEDDVHGMVDLDMHFARVDLWLRAGMYQEAHSVIDSMDALVRHWGSGAELRTQREALRGRLGDDRQSAMMNLAALGDIYSYSGEFSSAQSVYTDALAIAKGDQNREAIRKIHINMGYMFWEHGHLAEAEERYGWALGLAGEDDDDDGDRAAALTGLAECRQRQGDYRHAIMDALSAFEAACEADPEAAYDVALRLAKWYADLDRIPDALTMLARCDELVAARPNPLRQAKLLSLKAELYIYRDRYGEARSAAERAIDIARSRRDPVTLRRALTVLALTYMHMRDFPAARKEIEESARYRVAGKEISDLALRGIIAHRCGSPGTARDLFHQLRDETNNRTRADANDLVAWDFTGIAQCYSVLVDGEEPERALEAFRRARPESAEETPGLDDLLRFMVETLAKGDPRLEPVLTELARMRPGRAG